MAAALSASVAATKGNNNNSEIGGWGVYASVCECGVVLSEDVSVVAASKVAAAPIDTYIMSCDPPRKNEYSTVGGQGGDGSERQHNSYPATSGNVLCNTKQSKYVEAFLHAHTDTRQNDTTNKTRTTNDQQHTYRTLCKCLLYFLGMSCFVTVTESKARKVAEMHGVKTAKGSCLPPALDVPNSYRLQTRRAVDLVLLSWLRVPSVVTVAEATLKGNCRDDIYYRLKTTLTTVWKI
ncbi:unnamed protein product [Ceratitis capitata]|uniref:(Mediterranean fruit fly) hypothetical protein n=1 Tax=Ceratitis capitata TaxID=7213 RepID=A0A811UR73_CERCA|nr:unnamed protein product [Ceratitis capitata]